MLRVIFACGLRVYVQGGKSSLRPVELGLSRGAPLLAAFAPGGSGWLLYCQWLSEMRAWPTGWALNDWLDVPLP